MEQKKIQHEDVSIQLCIDTRFRKKLFKTTSADFNIQFSKPFKHVKSMELVAFEMPRCIYAISSKMGTNYLRVRSPSLTGAWVEVTIGDGNYTHSQMSQALQAAIRAKTGDINYVVGINIQTQKCTILHPTKSFDIQFKNPANEHAPPMETLGWMLGFRTQKYVHNTASALAYSIYTGEAVVDIHGPKYFYLDIDDHQYFVHHNIIGIYEESYLSKNILAKIPLFLDSNDVIMKQEEGKMFKQRKYTGLINLDRITVKLLSPYGTVLDTNGIDYSFTLQLEMVN
jgi:hypothetical protein